jgi:hypothetical protein
MNSSPSPFEQNDARFQLPGFHNGDAASRRGSRNFRLSPLGATVIAALGLAMVIGLENNWFKFHGTAPRSVSPAESVDISLRRLVRSRVVNRLQREHRVNGSLLENHAALDGELARICDHPLYVMIKEKMAEHLRNKGYQSVPIIQTADPRQPMLSIDAETALDDLIHSLRAFCSAPDAKVTAFLRDHEATFGDSVAAHAGGGGYDVVFAFLIQLVFEFPDELAPVASAVKFFPASNAFPDDGMPL